MSNDSATTGISPSTPFELVIVSGKGGTGKTSVTASLSALAQQAVIADCDVDAANMALLQSPCPVGEEDFCEGAVAEIDPNKCNGCGRCMRRCRFDAIERVRGDDGRYRCRVKSNACEGCGVCEITCPRMAITMHPVVGGKLYLSDTGNGPLVHARLKPGLGNSGKLTTLVRERARQQAKEKERPLVLVDGPPGVGCPAIAALTGASAVVAVTEPTPSGEEDLMRVLELCEHFRLPVQLCVNKADINPELSERIQEKAAKRGVPTLGLIPYDKAVLNSVREGLPVVKMSPDSPAALAIKDIWNKLRIGLPGQ